MFVKQDNDEEEEEEKVESKPEPIMGRGKRTAVLESKLRVRYSNYIIKSRI